MKGLFTALALFFSTGLYAEMEKPQPPAADPGYTQLFIMLGIGFLFFYFILWRPEQKQREELAAQRDNMQKGDKVIALGIVGTVSAVHKDTVILKMVDGAKIEFLKSAINEINPKSEE